MPRRSQTLAANRKRNQPQVVGFLGVGLDNKDGHQRLTRNEHFLLVGGSEETHEKMQETAVKFNEALENKGKKLNETSVEEIVDLFRGRNALPIPWVFLAGCRLCPPTKPRWCDAVCEATRKRCRRWSIGFRPMCTACAFGS
jgi:hypothetical protein